MMVSLKQGRLCLAGLLIGGVAVVVFSSVRPNVASGTSPGRSGVIVFDRSYQGQKLDAQLFSVNSDGSGLHKLTHGMYDANPSFSASGRRIVFVRYVPAEVGTNVFAMNANGTSVHRLTHDAADQTHPVFSPDGRKIIFERAPFNTRSGPGGIYVMNSNGSHVHLLHRMRMSSSEVSVLKSPDRQLAVSPSGRTIAFTSAVGHGKTEIFAMNFDGSNVHQLTNGGSSSGPDFSPDGTQIVFTAQHTQTQTVCAPPPHPPDCHTGTQTTTDIFVMNVDGSNVRELTNFTISLSPSSPTFSPDGKQIAFTHQSQQTTAIAPTQIYTMNADGSGVSQITQPSPTHQDQYPSWQPLP